MNAEHQKALLSPDFPLNVILTDVTEFPPHWHEVIEVVYAIDGSLRVGVNSKIYTMNPRDILLIDACEVHYFIPEPRRVNRLILHFNRTFLESLYPAAKNRRFAKTLLAEADNSSYVSAHRLLEAQFTELMNEHSERRDAFRIAMMARLYDILTILVRHLPMQDYPPHEKNRQLNRLGRLESVFKYVEDNYASDITLKEISSVANFSEFYFARFFKETTGMTFGRYLNSYRVEKAAQLLRDTDDSITEIVFKSGFGSVKTFNRVFKKIKGCSPSAYKKAIFEA